MERVNAETACDNTARPGIEIGYPGGMQEKGIALKDHKRLMNLAYEVKDYIDSKGGLSYAESCTFGQIMQTIIHLK